MRKTKPTTTPARLINPLERKPYVPSVSMQIAAQRARSQPDLISVNSNLKYIYHGDTK